MPVRFSDLIRGIGELGVEGFFDFSVKGIAENSQDVSPGFIFVAIKGEKTDGHAFIEAAVRKGATCCVVSQAVDIAGKGICLVRVRDTKKALSELARRFYGNAGARLKKIAITGTKGKTTTAYCIKALLDGALRPAGIIGTIEVRFGSIIRPSANTTPSTLTLQKMFGEMSSRGMKYVVMEVSSHAIVQKRVEGIDFQWIVFTNLSREHLDYHKTMGNYFLAKAALFKNASARAVAIINRDDAYGRKLIAQVAQRVVTVSTRDKRADVYVKVRAMDRRGTRFCAHTPRGVFQGSSPLFGMHNMENLAAGIAWACEAGIGTATIKKTIAAFRGPEGRLENIYSRGNFDVFVDYAHTDASLHCALRSLRSAYRGRPLFVVFGCGGARDKTKRPRMGNVAARFSDHVFVTNDNPRDEDPALIARGIIGGFPRRFKSYTRILDRKKAIIDALGRGRKEDAVVLIAGKGHEKVQVFKDASIPFSDKEVALDFLRGAHSHRSRT
jgi:UDP-N-acetylmuramoyl-L-alanyl-D-glutamate--2,6-diaminopimelate ligase